MSSRFTRAATVVLSSAVLVVPLAAPASGASQELASGLVGPLGLAVAPDGTVYVAEAFRGALSAVAVDGSRRDVHTGKDWLPGVDVAPDGSVVFTGGREKADGTRFETRLYRANRGGQASVIADLGRFESRHNPDADNEYGFLDLADACREQFPPELGGYSYHGHVESNPYAVAAAPDGSFYVADSAANAVLRVARHGAVSVVAVLPPQPVVFDQQTLDAFNEGLAEETPEGESPPVVPDCVVGATYAGEPVPTDVEIGPDGSLYVSVLPGFPGLPGTGAVYRIDGDGDLDRLGSGFSGSTDLAVSPAGDVYVAELFGHRVSRLVEGGSPETVAELTLPAAVEWAGGRLYVTHGVFSPEGGTLTTLVP